MRNEERERVMGKGKNLLCLSRVLWQASIAAIVALLFISPFCFPLAPDLFQAHAANPDATVVSTSTREGRLAVFDDTWSAINERYYDRRFHGLNWDAQRITFRSLAAETSSSAELYAVLRRMIASLNDPHTRVFAPEEKSDWWHPRFVSIGLAVGEIGGLPTVVHVEHDSAPQRAGIRAGDVIETVNGSPALSLVNSRLMNSLRPTASVRFRAFATIMEGPPESSIEIGWKKKDGTEGSSQFRRRWQQRDLGLRVRREKGDYAVIEMDAFTQPIALSFTSLLKEKLKGVRGVIIDLRGNGGGDAEAMADIASAFLGEGFGLGQFTDRSGSSFTISTSAKSLLAFKQIIQSKLSSSLPLVVLTSERTSSAAEILITALKTSRRATIIGTETCGCVLAIRTRHLLPDGGLLDISELDYQTSAGTRLEGHGIQPDETVVVERNDLYSGRDRAMESAIARLKFLRHRSTSGS
jgi:carboxyl-terminal processing protease